MREAVFVDTLHWVALINPRDQWHTRAVATEQALGDVPLLTTDEVLIEVLNSYAESGSHMRAVAGEFVRELIDDPDVEVISRDWESFLAGLHLYERRLDKGYSLTDCTSMNVMKTRGIREALTHDHHFVQEGFVTLIPD